MYMIEVHIFSNVSRKATALVSLFKSGHRVEVRTKDWSCDLHNRASANWLI